MSKKVFITTDDEVKICGVWELPGKPTNKAIILVHGLTVTKDEGGKFVELSSLLTESEYAVFRFDFRGHGESEGRQEEMTIKGELIDLKTTIDYVEKEGYKDIGLVGASFGGGVSILYFAQNQKNIKALVLLNPCLNYDHDFINPYLPWLKNKKDQIKKDLKEKGFTEIGSLKYRMGKAVFEEMKNLFPYKEMKKITIPTMIIHGNADMHIPYEDSKNYFHNLAGPKEFVTIEGAEHGLHDDPEHSQIADENSLRFFQKYL